MKRVAEHCDWSMEWIRRKMVHLRVFNAALSEPRSLELPVEMIATIFENMKQRSFVFGITEVDQRSVHPSAM